MKITTDNGTEIIVPKGHEEKVRGIIAEIVFGKREKKGGPRQSYSKKKGGPRNSRWTKEASLELADHFKAHQGSRTAFARQKARETGRTRVAILAKLATMGL